MAKPLTTQFLDFGTGERFQSGGSFGWVSATPVAFRLSGFSENIVQARRRTCSDLRAFYVSLACWRFCG